MLFQSLLIAAFIVSQQFKSQQFGVELFRPMRELFEDEIKHFIECQTISIPDEQFHQNNLDRVS